MTKSWTVTLYEGATSCDTYGQHFSFLIFGKRKINTLIGSVISLIAAVLVILYAQQKWMLLKEYDDSNISESTSERAIFEKEIFSSSMGFRTAFAITAFDGSPDSIEDESFGILKPYYIAWGENNIDIDNESLSLSGFTEIPTRPCVAEDFGLDP